MRSHYAAVRRVTNQIEALEAEREALNGCEYTRFHSVKLPVKGIIALIDKEIERLEKVREFHAMESEKPVGDFTPSRSWDSYIASKRGW